MRSPDHARSIACPAQLISECAARALIADVLNVRGAADAAKGHELRNGHDSFNQSIKVLKQTEQEKGLLNHLRAKVGWALPPPCNPFQVEDANPRGASPASRGGQRERREGREVPAEEAGKDGGGECEDVRVSAV